VGAAACPGRMHVNRNDPAYLLLRLLLARCLGCGCLAFAGIGGGGQQGECWGLPGPHACKPKRASRAACKLVRACKALFTSRSPADSMTSSFSIGDAF
jgi:hypothetical protein